MYEIGVAVAGAGFIGPVHVEGLRRAGCRVVGILGIDEAESRRAAETLGLPKAYSSFEQLLEDKEVGSVHLAVPNRLHYSMAKQVLQAGKHVLCEKPLAMNSRESAELVELARQKKNLAAGVNYNIRYYPMALEARQRVRSGQIGQVFHVAGSYVQDWLLYPTDYNWRVLAKEGGELRAVSDIGTHWLDLVQAITGMEIQAVCADLRTVHPVRQRPRGEVETYSGKTPRPEDLEPVDITTDDYGAILLEFQGGARGVLWVSQVTAGRKNRLRYEIAGAEHALAWESEVPNELWVGHRRQANEVLLRDPSLLSPPAARHASFPGGHNEGFPDTFKQCFRAFYDYIAAGDFQAEPTYPTFADGHREIILCDAILKSHKDRRWVSVEEVKP